MRFPILVAGLALVAACDQPAPEASPTATPAASVTPASPTSAAAQTDAPATAIPAALHGRWGMVPADCTSTRGDNKGILEIGPDTLRFFESRGRLGKIASTTPQSIRATYAFTGEGMEWTREMQLRLVSGDGGSSGGTTRLERTDFGPDAEAGPLIYERCTA